MSGVAFYAPLKSPDHPTPSGDRRIARNLMEVLRDALDLPVTLVSNLRSFEPSGDADRQSQLFDQAAAEVERLCQTLSGARLWVSYHNYYKAPDLLGPATARALGIPYVLIEATRAQSRLAGPWARFAQAAEAASDAAKVIFHFTSQDRIALDRDRTRDQDIVDLPPFLNRTTLPAGSTGTGSLLSVGMMRAGDKLASYRLVAEALAQAKAGWVLDIAGDGPVRAEVEALFAPFGDRVRFHGALDPDALAQLYRKAKLFLWPGVNEAFGMVYLEAQAHGLPVVAQDRPGVRDVLAPGDYPSVDSGGQGLAHMLDKLLLDAALQQRQGDAARTYIAQRHLRPAAERCLRTTLTPLLAEGS